MNACDRRLWSEIFNHPPLVNVPQMDEAAYDKVFEWEVEKNEEGGYKRLGILLHVVRNHALMLRRAGNVGNVGRIASIGIYLRCNPNPAVSPSAAPPQTQSATLIPSRKVSMPAAKARLGGIPARSRSGAVSLQ